MATFVGDHNEQPPEYTPPPDVQDSVMKGMQVGILVGAAVGAVAFAGVRKLLEPRFLTARQKKSLRSDGLYAILFGGIFGSQVGPIPAALEARKRHQEQLEGAERDLEGNITNPARIFEGATLTDVTAAKERALARQMMLVYAPVHKPPGISDQDFAAIQEEAGRRSGLLVLQPTILEDWDRGGWKGSRGGKFGLPGLEHLDLKPTAEGEDQPAKDPEPAPASADGRAPEGGEASAPNAAFDSTVLHTPETVLAAHAAPDAEAAEGTASGTVVSAAAGSGPEVVEQTPAHDNAGVPDATAAAGDAAADATALHSQDTVWQAHCHGPPPSGGQQQGEAHAPQGTFVPSHPDHPGHNPPPAEAAVPLSPMDDPRPRDIKRPGWTRQFNGLVAWFVRKNKNPEDIETEE